MMAYGEDREELAAQLLPNAKQPELTDDEDEFELISARETLVFEDAIRNPNKSPSFFQEYLLNKIQPGSGEPGIRFICVLC